MANQKLSIDVFTNLTITDETAEKCCRLLEMWMDEDPYRKVVCEARDESHWRLRLVRGREDGKE